MTHICYSDEPEPFTGRPVPYLQQRPTRAWVRHYTNYLLLDFMARRSPDRAEVAQARREIAICQARMDRCRRHPCWDAEEAARGRAQADAIWQSARQARVRGDRGE
jgi:hypothetical protein